MSVDVMLTIIVPVYNTEKHLDRCIDTILKNLFTNFELLLIDDGSTDSSLEIVSQRAKQDPRIRIIFKANEGVSKTRNLGIQTALGKFAMFIDNDDYIEENYISTFLNKCLKGNSHLVIGGIGELMTKKCCSQIILVTAIGENMSFYRRGLKYMTENF